MGSTDALVRCSIRIFLIAVAKEWGGGVTLGCAKKMGFDKTLIGRSSYNRPIVKKSGRGAEIPQVPQWNQNGIIR